MGQTDSGIQVGKTKVFFRRKAFDLLENVRRERTTSAALILQKTARKHLALKHFAKAILSAITIQSAVREALAKKVVMGMRQQHNSTIIQRSWRKYAAKKLLSSAKIVSRWCQSHYRGKVGRCVYNMLNRGRKVVLIESQWRRYIALTSFKRQINAVINIQSARRCYIAKVKLKARKSEAQDINRLKEDVNALRNELKKLKDGKKVDQVYRFGNSEKDIEIRSLRVALDQLSKEKDAADNQLEVANKMLITLKSERDSAAQDRDDLKQVNIIIQSELNTREEELHRIKKEVKKSKIVLDESSNVKEAHTNIDDTDTTHIFQLKAKLSRQEEINVALQTDNTRLQHENSVLLSETAVLAESSKDARKDYMKEPIPRYSETTYKYQNNASVATTDCTSFTVDMDVIEDETVRLREENQVLRKQLELLRISDIFNDLEFDDQNYDESVEPDSVSSGSTLPELPESVMKQSRSDVAKTTQNVMIKTRSEYESSFMKLQAEFNELYVEMDRCKRLTKYDVDDMTRVNRSLRADLEAMAKEKFANEEELEMKCAQYDELYDDLERLSETFVVQYEELQHMEHQIKNLKLENMRLKASDAEKLKIIGDLKHRLEENVFSGPSDEFIEVKGEEQAINSSGLLRG